MKLILKLVSLILISWILYSCAKNIKINEPIVEIYSPVFKQQYLLPDTVYVSFRVEHNKPVEYIRISIDDKNIIPVSNQEFLYPEGNNYEGDLYLPVSLLAEDISIPPYYFHVVVSDFSEINHTYREISLLNKEIKYNGCFLIGKSGINMLNINYFDHKFQQKLTTSTNGNYSGSGISANANMIYLITNTPDLVRAISCDKVNIIWSKEPQLPYPEFNSVLVENKLTYFSTAIGRIIGLTNDEGIQIFTTPVLPDSIPINICSTTDYLVSDFSLRKSNSKAWVSFYKKTGNKFQVFPTNYETVSMYGGNNNNLITLFCNKNSIGSIIQYDIVHNNIETKLELNNIEIHRTCEIDENNFLFSSNGELFQFNKDNQSYVKIKDVDDTIVDLKFDNLNDRLFVLHPNRVDIYSYTGFTKITTIESTNLLKGIELKFGY